MIELNQIPPMDEVWKVGDKHYVVRYVDRTQPPVPLVWEVRGDDVQALGIKKPTRTISSQDFQKAGALPMGSTRELLNTKEDPLEVLYSNYQTEVRVKPWLADPEILALWAGAALEGRSITDSELQGTDWWRTKTDGERQWLSLNASDPATADALIRDNRIRVQNLFQQAGVSNATDELIQTVADQWTQGAWTEVYATNQIQLLADPNIEGALDPLLTEVAPSLDTTEQGEDTVRDMIRTWLGPAAAENWSDDHISKWGSKFREDPDARQQLERVLAQHRVALFPEYEDKSLTYEDIAAPWRGVWSGILGGVADETSNLFERVVRMNDRGAAERELRQHGLREGNETVSQNLLSQMNQAFGGSVRRSDPAVL